MHPLLPLIAFTSLYWLAAGGRALATGNSEFLLYIGQMGLLGILVLWAHRLARFSMPVLWMLSVWGLMHLAGGTVPVPPQMAQINDEDQTHAVLYGLWFIRDVFKYDNLVHMYGFFAATLACGEALRPFLARGARPRLALFVVIAGAGMGLGAVNEIIEFIATVVFPKTNVGDYRNNALDLCWNAVGACAAAALTCRSLARAARSASASAAPTVSP